MSDSQYVEPAHDVTSHSLDTDGLKHWVQQQHLSREALARCAVEYETAPIPLLRLRDFLRPSVAEKLYTLLGSEAAFEDIHCLRGVERPVERTRWLEAKDSKRLSKYSRLADVQPNPTSFNPLLYLKFISAIAERPFINFFELITKTRLGPLQSIGGKAMGAGDFLRPHDDRGYNRRLAFIIYLNPHWQPSYGGALRVHGRNGEDIIIEAEYNSLVVFDVLGHEYHVIEDIKAAAGEQRRLTLGGWFKDPEPEA